MIRRITLAMAWLAVTALIAPVAPVAEAPPDAQQDPAPLPAPQEEATTQPAPVADSPAVEQQPAPEPDPDASPAAPSVPSAPASDRTTTSAPAATPTSEPAPKTRAKGKRGPMAVAAASGSVTIKDFSFGPSSVTVGVGDTVTWSNAGPSEHTATATDGSFDTGLLSRNESGSATFNEAGTFSYLCEPHPFMKGTVRVVAQTSDNSEGAGSTGSTDGTGTDDGVASATTSQSDGAQLPSTGAHPAWLAITGLGLLLIGATGLRRGKRVGAP